MPTPGNSPGFRRPKEARAATTAALPAYTLGADGVFTANANGALPAQDGITLAAGDNFLSKNETGGRQAYNWVMQLIDPGSGGTPFKFQRAPGFPLRNGEPVFIGQGATLQAKIFMITTPDPIVVNTTAITTSQAGGSSASAAIFNVLDHGAKADCTLDNVGNVTGGTDNTTAVQAALTALQTAKQGILYFPAGKYLFTAGNLAVAAEQVIVTGDGEASQIVVDCGANRWMVFNSPETMHVCDLAFLGNNAASPNCSTVFYHNNTTRALYERLNFYGIGAISNLIQWANASATLYQIFIGGCFVTDGSSANANGFIGAIQTGTGMEVDDFESKDYGVIDGIGYSRSGGGALSAINLGEIFSGGAPDYGQVDAWRTGAYLLRNLRIDEGARSAVRGIPSVGRYERIEIDGLSMNLNDNTGINIASADSLEIKNCYWGLHGGSPFVAIKLVDAGNVRIQDCHCVSSYIFQTDSLTKYIHIKNTVYYGFKFDSTAPYIIEEINGIPYVLRQAAGAFAANSFVVPAASGQVNVASTAKVSGDVQGIAIEAPAFAIGSITAVPKANLINSEYLDMPTVEGQSMRIEFDNGAPVNPAEVHYDYSGIGGTAINIATGFVAAFNAFGARKYDASNVGGTSAVITFTARALGSQYNGALGGNIFSDGNNWHRVDPVGGLANIHILEKWGERASLKTDGNYAIGDYLLPSGANAGQGLKAASGNFCALVVAPTSGGLTPVIFGKFTV